MGPSNGLTTSLRSRREIRETLGSRPPNSTLARSFSDPPPGANGFPLTSRKETPNSSSIPLPPSEQAVPPTVNMISEALLSKAALIITPTPLLEARKASSALEPGTKTQAWDDSITAVVPIQAERTDRGTPCASGASPSRASKPCRTSESTVPSPPSANGTETTVQSGATDKIPFASADAHRCDDREDLKESGAMTIFMDRRQPIIPLRTWLASAGVV